MGREKAVRVHGRGVGDHHGRREWLSLVVTLWLASLRGCQALLLENLLLRQQLAVALRARHRPRLAWHDRMFSVVMRRLCPDWGIDTLSGGSPVCSGSARCATLAHP